MGMKGRQGSYPLWHGKQGNMELERIGRCFSDHRKVLEKTELLIPDIEKMAVLCAKALEEGHKILLCGNGGSAADAQHIAAEFVGRFHNERISLPAIALTTDTSILTAVGNDYSYDRVFARQVEGLGQKGDVFWGITTSGNSANVVEAAKLAKEKGLVVIGSLGKDGGKMAPLCDAALIVPDDSTARIQEMHILCAHSICEVIDEMEWK